MISVLVASGLTTGTPNQRINIKIETSYVIIPPVDVSHERPNLELTLRNISFYRMYGVQSLFLLVYRIFI